MNKRIKKKQLAMTYRRFDKYIDGAIRIKPLSYVPCRNGLVMINKRFITASLFREFRIMFFNSHYGLISSETESIKKRYINSIMQLSKYLNKFPKWSIVETPFLYSGGNINE